MMRVLTVSVARSGQLSPFVCEQVEALRKAGCTVECFGVEGKGIKGYAASLGLLRKKIEAFKPDIIHAHYGFCGLLSNYQRKIPVVTTYHGSDIHSLGKNLFLSRISMRLSSFNIFVSEKLRIIAGYKGPDSSVIPCGVDTELFKAPAKERDRHRILFAGSFDNPVKNPVLAKQAVALLDSVELVEMKGLTRPEVAELMATCGCLLMTSLREGSPQVIKEALCCCCPVVSVDVGDVVSIAQGADGFYLAELEPVSLAEKLKEALTSPAPSGSSRRITELGLSGKAVADRIIDIYSKILHRT